MSETGPNTVTSVRQLSVISTSDFGPIEPGYTIKFGKLETHGFIHSGSYGRSDVVMSRYTILGGYRYTDISCTQSTVGYILIRYISVRYMNIYMHVDISAN